MGEKMKLERTKNSISGIRSGIINKIVVLIAPFIVRTIFIRTLGIEYLGLNSLFSSILNILNLAELGIGSAIVFSLYSAIAKNNEEKICCLMNFYKKTYRIIGIVVVIIGLLILPFINIFCNGDVPNDMNIYFLFLMYLFNTALTYFLYAYKNCLLSAYQQTNIINNVNTCVKIVLNLLQAIFLILGQGYYVYLILLILATMAENIINAIIVTKKYPNYKAKGTLPKEEEQNIFRKIKALFLYKIGGVVLTSVDSVVISTFLGLTILGQYNNYYYVITALFGFFQVYTNAMLAGIGNSIVEESVEKNKKDFDRLNFIQGWIVGWCTVCLVCLYENFIELWAGAENVLGMGVTILLSIDFYIWKMLDINNLYKEAAGLWEYDKYRQLVASVFNLIINIILVKIIGLYGIILSTILSIAIIIFPWSTYTLFKRYFKKGYKVFLIKNLINIIVTLIAICITFIICNFIKDINLVSLIIKGLICIIVPNIVFFVLYCKTKSFKDTFSWGLEKIKANK